MISQEVHSTELLIIGGGAAGCMAAIRAKQMNADLKIAVIEKANIERSGCLAMGLNAVNAYLTGTTIEEYVQYIKQDNYNIVREDLIYSIGRRLSAMVEILQDLGIPFPRNSEGSFVKRSSRSIIMHGEHIKPILAETVRSLGIKIYNRTPAYRLLVDHNNVVTGAVGFNVRTGTVLTIQAGAVLICTGGASGIYRPSNPGLPRTKTWYCPYNAGSGLAMGIRAGAEMTSFEMRFVALRTKDVIAPTGTLVLDTQMTQRNARGEEYLKTKKEMLGRNLTTSERLRFTIDEHKKGTGPCYIDLSILDAHHYTGLIKSYLHMAPSVLLHLLENPDNPHKQIEVCGSEPYINGGHGLAGFWVDVKRQTTLKNLYAAGDAAGGAPKKYVTGCFAEAEMAVANIEGQYRGRKHPSATTEAQRLIETLTAPLHRSGGLHFTEAEQRLQKIMEEYAGGSTQNYETSRDKLLIAKKNLESLSDNSREICAGDWHELMRAQDTLDRIILSRVLVEHMLARKETRWPCYQTRLDYPARNDIEYNVFINSIWSTNRPVTFKRSCLPPYPVIHNKAETYADTY